MATFTSAGTKVDKPSFAKVHALCPQSPDLQLMTPQVVAAGLKSPSPAQKPTASAMLKPDNVGVPSSIVAKSLSPPNKQDNPLITLVQEKLVPVTLDQKRAAGESVEKDAYLDSKADEITQMVSLVPVATIGCPMTDEVATHASSSDSVMPPSSANKSRASGTTFALDEKESLRPDDSASVKGRDDDDGMLATPGQDAAMNAYEEVRAFRDQLQEITGLQPVAKPCQPQGFAASRSVPQGVLYVPPPPASTGAPPSSTRDITTASSCAELPPDPKLLEALDSPKDRIMVLKLEQDYVDFVKDAKESSLKLPQTNTFYRMLAHKLADYYMLGHTVDESTMAVRIFKTPACRLPPPLTGIATPSTAASTPPPTASQMKILRRGGEGAGIAIVNGSNFTSKTTSENGESGNEDDKKGKVVTREQREARYEAARKRIMGSAKPISSPEEAVTKDESRSSSALGRRATRKKRHDSDDDFEARSAYSAYYAVPQLPPTPTMSSYGYSNISRPQPNPFSPVAFGQQAMASQYTQHGDSSYYQHPGNGYPQQHVASNWYPTLQPAYDLPGELQRTLSLQPSPMPSPNTATRNGFYQGYGMASVSSPQPWSHQGPYAAQHPSPAAPGYHLGYSDQTGQSHFAQSPYAYPYGQLPSQTIPGRPPNNLEHPLPGSYKSKHFDPQSQNFIPSQGNDMNSIHMQHQASTMNQRAFHSNFDMPAAPQRHDAVSISTPIYSQPQRVPYSGGPARPLVQPMTHPLPQPVFPRQPSPNLPLPQRPQNGPQRSMDRSAGTASISTGHNSSTIAKWGTTSLPAKPPPAMEATPGAATHAQGQQQNGGFGSGRSSNGLIMPTFGSMPPINGNFAVNGQSSQIGRYG